MSLDLVSGPDAPSHAADALLDAIRRELDAAELLEHRAAALGALLERHGPTYLGRAVSELDAALADYEAAAERRRSAGRELARELGLSEDAPLRELVSASESETSEDLLAEGRRRHARLTRLSEENTDLLGGRMEAVAAALSDVGAAGPSTYGRHHPAEPRLVRGVL